MDIAIMIRVSPLAASVFLFLFLFLFSLIVILTSLTHSYSTLHFMLLLGRSLVVATASFVVFLLLSYILQLS